jgi:hypothetical protein
MLARSQKQLASGDRSLQALVMNKKGDKDDAIIKYSFQEHNIIS